MSRRSDPRGMKKPHVDLYCEQGRQLVSAGDLQRATRVFQVACVRFPLESDPWIGLAICLKKLGKPGVAERALTTARALGAHDPALLVHRAECQLRCGDIDSAKRDLLTAASEALIEGDEMVGERARRGLEHLEGQAGLGSYLEGGVS